MSNVRRAFVLAAGLGTRLRPLTDERPKPAWPFFDVPLAALVLRALASSGVSEAIVNLHHLGPQLQQELAPWLPPGLAVRWSPEESILGTGGALVPWRALLATGPFFLCNADTVQDVDFAALDRFHCERGALATLTVRPVPPGVRAPLEIADDGRLVRFLGSRAPGAAPGTPCEFTGIHRLDPSLLGELPSGRFCVNADVHQPLVVRGAPLYGYVTPEDGYWSDLGTPGRYVGAHRAFLAAGRLSDGARGRLVTGTEETQDGGTLVGPSYLGDGARVEKGATAGPWAVVGARAVLADGARVASSVVWPGCRVAAETLFGSILSPSGRRLAADRPAENRGVS